MYSFDWNNLGKGVKVKKSSILFYGSPFNSSGSKYLVAGEVLEKITGFINPKDSTGINQPFIQLNDNQYVPAEAVEVVELGTDDDSNILERTFAGFKSTEKTVKNKINDAGRNLAKGWEITKGRSFIGMLDYVSSDLKKSLMLGAVVMVAFFILQTIIKIRY